MMNTATPPSTTTLPLGANDIGQTVWALIDAQDPMVICDACGAPDKRCDHAEHWARVDIPSVVSGALMGITKGHEQAEPTYMVEDAGESPPRGVYRTEAEAHAAVRAEFGEQLAKLGRWVAL